MIHLTSSPDLLHVLSIPPRHPFRSSPEPPAGSITSPLRFRLDSAVVSSSGAFDTDIGDFSSFPAQSLNSRSTTNYPRPTLPGPQQTPAFLKITRCPDRGVVTCTPSTTEGRQSLRIITKVVVIIVTRHYYVPNNQVQCYGVVEPED